MADDVCPATAMGTLREASNAGEAFLLCEEDARTIHLLLSDVVMPKMSGPRLAKRLTQTRPSRSPSRR